MEKKKLSRILAKAPSDAVRSLAEPLMSKYAVNVIRPPLKTLVMVRMRETVAGAAFYLGEMLACEALVEVMGRKGFALMAGDDMEKVLAAAVLDAVLKTELPEKQALTVALLEQEKEIAKAEQQQIRAHAKSRVQFSTLDVGPV